VELENLRRRQKTLEKNLEAASRQITNSPLNQLEKLEEQLFVSLKAKYDEINQLLGDYWIRRERGEASERPPEGLQKLMNEFEEIQRSYQQSKAKIQQRLQEDGLSGGFGLEMRAMAVELWGEAKTYQGERASAGSLVWKMEKLQDEIDAVEDEMSQYQERYEFLQKSLIDRYSDGVFSVETYSLADILERPYADWETYISFIQDAWSRWQVLWKERPAVGKASFY
jgi:chaperonin cofactor prefoldin